MGSLEEKVKNFMPHFKACDQIVKKYIKYLLGADIIDIGSNVGFFSKALVDNLAYKSIHLFEPSKEYYEYSVSLLKGKENIYFNNYGLSDTDTMLTLYKSRDNNIGWNTFLKKDPNQHDGFIYGMDTESCHLKRLDDYKIDNVDFIKIDVEGFEHKVLEGGMNLIAKYKPYILIEVGWGTNHPCWNECEKQYNKLFELGYKRVAFTRNTEDILFVPISRDNT